MRIFIAILLSLVCCFSAVAYCESYDFSGMTDDELLALHAAVETELADRQAAAALANGFLTEGDLGDYHVKIISAALTHESNGTPCLLVTYEFTNNSDDNHSFLLAISDVVCQGGVQCEPSQTADGVDSIAQLDMIRPGESIEVASGYVLIDTVTPIEIKLTQQFSLYSTDEILITIAVPE